jgi:glycosyltransferase involved in cell wall biosynthesis
LKVVLFANTEWYLYNFRRSLASALRDAGHEVLLLSPPGPYGEKLRALGFRWLPAPMERRSLNPLRELALVNWLRGLVRDEQVDLVHGFTIKCAVYGSLAAHLAGVPARVNAVAGMGYVFSSNDLKAKALRPVVRAMMHVALGGRSARLVLQNPDDVAFFQRARVVDPATIRLIPGSGVDCIRFAPDGARQRGARFRVLLPARLLWDKGVAEYVEAARRLHAAGRAIDFLLAGDPDPGNPAAVPEAQIRGWVEEGLLQWLGHVDDMPALFASVDAVVLPSYREGLPKGLIEAGACGLPLVTTDVPGCREVVTDGVDGLLVQVRDAATLAAAIARLHDDAALCERLGRAAREKALAAFDEKIVLGKTLAVYAELV